MNDTEVAYNEAKSLLDVVKKYVELKSEDLAKARVAIDTSPNNQARAAIAGNLRVLRQNILAHLNSLK
jgi:hypothetical protein